MIENLALRVAVTLLLAFSIAGLLYLIATARHCRTGLGAHLLCIVMNAAMLVMAWRLSGGLPILGLIVFFVLAAVWSLAVMFSAETRSGRLSNAYHVSMMLAMAWMYAVMSGDLSPTQSHTDMNMPGMDMPVPQPTTVRSDMSHPAWITMIDWTLAIGLRIRSGGLAICACDSTA